jgi:release factor glutamine methyltransferase
VFAEDEAALLLDASSSPGDLDSRVARRVAGEPLEQILGWAEFCGLRVLVAPTVFVPRRRTELVVREAARLVGPGGVVVDLCCGTGAVGLAVVAQVPGVQLHAADLDPAAVACARRNVEPVGGHVHEGDLDAPLPVDLRGRVDVITANAPYVPTDEVAFMPSEARDHEARVALDGGADGLDLHRRIAALAPGWLRPGGHLLVETSERQADRTAEAFVHHGLTAHVVTDDDLDATVVVGVRP